MFRSPELLRIVRVLTSRVEVTISIAVVVLLMLIAATAGFTAPHDPYKQSLMDSLQPMSAAHPFGTDALGRDVLSRLMYGARVSLQVGIISVGIASTVGITLGLVAGYYRGIVDAVIMRTVDALMSIPPIILALAMAAALGGGLFNVMMALGIALIPAYARLMRGLVLVVRELDYVTSARVDGASAIRIMLHHVLPNCFPPLLVLVTLNMGQAILAEAALSFLGIGISPPGAAWGAMVNDGYRYLATNPTLSLVPGICIMLTVLAFNIAGDGLRDALDPRLRGVV